MRLEKTFHHCLKRTSQVLSYVQRAKTTHVLLPTPHAFPRLSGDWGTREDASDWGRGSTHWWSFRLFDTNVAKVTGIRSLTPEKCLSFWAVSFAIKNYVWTRSWKHCVRTFSCTNKRFPLLTLKVPGQNQLISQMASAFLRLGDKIVQRI